MDRQDYINLAKIRMERSRELLEEAKVLLSMNAYKSANNRAFYAMEKGVKALLAMKHTDVKTHNGALVQFNKLFIGNDDAFFDKADYKKIAKVERIRNASDYDDFYLASKEESSEQVKVVEEFVNKVDKYIIMEMSHDRVSVLGKLHANQEIIKEQKRDNQVQTREVEREKQQ